MIIANVFFLLCSLVALVGAVGTVAAKNPIRGAVGLLATIIGIAGLFLELHAQFLAAIQLIVYAGAVVVLFVFVIMLLGPDAAATQNELGPASRGKLLRGLAAAFFGLLGVATLLLGAGLGAEPTRFGELRPDHGSVKAVGRLLFTEGLVPFELATALLIVAVVGAIAVARSRYAPSKRNRIDGPTRLFHGPVHPRDAGRPLPKESVS
jgi:NADH-quinone oxidoreductase subunit J